MAELDPSQKADEAVDSKKKKKGLGALKSIRRFFTGQRKDTRKVSKTSREHDGLSKSLSAESVFMQEQKAKSGKAAFTKSLEAITKQEALPDHRAGPLSYNSELQLATASGDNEDPENDEVGRFFHSSWSVNQSNLQLTTASSAELDLDAIPTTSHVNVKSQRDKLVIKQRGKRQSTAHNQRKRTASPAGIAQSLQVLPISEEVDTRQKRRSTEMRLYDPKKANVTEQPSQSLEPEVSSAETKGAIEKAGKRKSAEQESISVETKPRAGSFNVEDSKASDITLTAKADEVPSQTPEKKISIIPNHLEPEKDVTKTPKETEPEKIEVPTKVTESAEEKPEEQRDTFADKIPIKQKSIKEQKNNEEVEKAAEGTEISRMLNKFKKTAVQRKIDTEKRAEEVEAEARKGKVGQKKEVVIKEKTEKKEEKSVEPKEAEEPKKEVVTRSQETSPTDVVMQETKPKEGLTFRSSMNLSADPESKKKTVPAKRSNSMATHISSSVKFTTLSDAPSKTQEEFKRDSPLLKNRERSRTAPVEQSPRVSDKRMEGPSPSKSPERKTSVLKENKEAVPEKPEAVPEKPKVLKEKEDEKADKPKENPGVLKESKQQVKQTEPCKESKQENKEIVLIKKEEPPAVAKTTPAKTANENVTKEPVKKTVQIKDTVLESEKPKASSQFKVKTMDNQCSWMTLARKKHQNWSPENDKPPETQEEITPRPKDKEATAAENAIKRRSVLDMVKNMEQFKVS